MTLESWQFTEILVTLRDYQTLLNQTAVLLMTSAGVLAFKNRRLIGRIWSLRLSGFALCCGITGIIIGFYFRSKLVDVIPNLTYKEHPSSVIDPALRYLTISQVLALSAGAIALIVAAAKTPRDRKTSGE